MNPENHRNPDKYQQAWQAHSSRTHVTIDAALLLNEMQRSHRNFRSMIFWRDFREVVIAVLLIPLWFYLGATLSLPWTWYLTVPALIWMAGFILVYRLRHPQKPNEADEPLLQCVKNSLTQVEDQIWLLRNIFWWYLLPPSISILAFFAQITILDSLEWLDALFRAGAFVLLSAFLVTIYYFIYYLNQRAVRLQLQPRRQELLTLLASLGDEPVNEPIAMSGTMSLESSRIHRRWLIVSAVACVAILVLVVLAGGFFDSSYDGPSRSSGPTGDVLASLITDLRKEKNLVGLAAMKMVNGQIEAATANGERKKGSGVPLEVGDRWHLGGITKSITATMIARLVESGRMQWSDTVGEIFSEAAVHEDWQQVTLKQLLTDTAGAPANFSLLVALEHPALGPERTQARRNAVLNVVAEKPANPPGEKYVYSNVGYTIAGAMAEKVTGATWEDLVKQEVFEPLKLTGAGFGPPESTDESLEQPRGHREVLGFKLPLDDESDNTPIIGPAATVHMTLSDLCTYATEHLRGDLGEGQLLSAETYKLLHTPQLNDYACGWSKKVRGTDIPDSAYWHNGSNTMWYALVVLIPEKNMVVAVTSNDGDITNAEAAAWEIVKASVTQVGVPRDEAPLEAGLPKKSSFAAVRWPQSQPVGKVEGEWFKLKSLDELPAAAIVTLNRQSDGNKWRKRFEEGLVKRLTRKGHPPQDNVTLVVQTLASLETRTLGGVPMTYAERRAIEAAAQAR